MKITTTNHFKSQRVSDIHATDMHTCSGWVILPMFVFDFRLLPFVNGLYKCNPFSLRRVNKFLESDSKRLQIAAPVSAIRGMKTLAYVQLHKRAHSRSHICIHKDFILQWANTQTISLILHNILSHCYSDQLKEPTASN